VLTVPAVWSDAAKVATLQAAERAGMGSRYDMQMISEPEAATLYALQTARPAGKAVDIGDNVGPHLLLISLMSSFRCVYVFCHILFLRSSQRFPDINLATCTP